jgi:heme A synthase
VSTPSDSREEDFSLYADSPAGSSRAFAALVSRPPEMWAGAIFLTLAAVPLAVFGFGLVAMPGKIGENLRQKLSTGGSNPDTTLLLLRIGGGVLLVLAVAFIVAAWLAWRPSVKARLGASVLAGLTVVGLGISMVMTAVDPVSVGMVLLAVTGTMLMHLPRSEEFMIARG